MYTHLFPLTIETKTVDRTIKVSHIKPTAESRQS